MLFSANVVKGCALEANDGQIGKITDFYFDDGSWQVRYLVVDVGNWLHHQNVLLIPEVVTAVDPDAGIIQVTASKEEVANSPDMLEQQPVSRQMEVALHSHYNWDPYWDVDPVGVAGFGHGAATLVKPGDGVKATVDVQVDAEGLAVSEGEMPITAIDPGIELRPSGRLRSTTEVRGYQITALDGEIGHVSDFLLKDTLGEIGYLVVETGNWWSGKKVIIPPAFARAIHWDGSKVDLILKREEIKNAPEFVEDNLPFVAPGFEAELRDYYMRRAHRENV